MKKLPIPTITTHGTLIPAHGKIADKIFKSVAELDIVYLMAQSAVLSQFRDFYAMCMSVCNCGSHILTSYEIIAYALIYRDPEPLGFGDKYLAMEYGHICRYLDSELFNAVFKSHLLKKKLGVK